MTIVSRARVALVLAVMAVLLIAAVPSLAASPASADVAGVDQLAAAQASLANCQLLAAHSATSAQHTRATQCVTDQTRIIALLTAPSPSPSSSSTSSPTPTPTTPGPTVTPTPTPSQTTPTPATGCMPVPSTCGYPDATNTGVPAGVTLTVVSGLVADQPGHVYEGLDIRGCVTVSAPNVTIRDSRVTGGCDPLIAIRPYDNEVTGTVLDHLDITQTSVGANAIAFRQYTLTASHIRTAGDCGRVDGNVTIADSYCEILAGGPADGPHYDGWQTEPLASGTITIRHNTVRNPYSQTSALAMWTAGVPITIVDNLLAGGGWTLYCQGSPNIGVTVTGNRFSRLYYAKGGYWGPVADCDGAVWSGNLWDDTGAAI